MKEKKIIPLEEVLSKFNKHNKEFIKGIEHEEQIENVETVNTIENEIKAMKYTTDIKKTSFINEIKGDLGKVVRENPNAITVIEKPKLKWYDKLKIILKSLFTKF